MVHGRSALFLTESISIYDHGYITGVLARPNNAPTVVIQEDTSIIDHLAGIGSLRTHSSSCIN